MIFTIDGNELNHVSFVYYLELDLIRVKLFVIFVVNVEYANLQIIFTIASTLLSNKLPSLLSDFILYSISIKLVLLTNTTTSL